MRLMLSFLLGIPYKKDADDNLSSSSGLRAPSRSFSDTGTYKNNANIDQGVSNGTLLEDASKSDSMQSKIPDFDKCILKPCLEVKQSFTITYAPYKGEKLQININFLGTYAKISLKNRMRAVKCIEGYNAFWIAFTVLHYYKNDMEMGKNSQQHVIHFEIKPSPEIIGTQNNEMYIEFVKHHPQFPILEKTSSPNSVPQVEKLSQKVLNKPGDLLIGTVSPVHRSKLLKVIKNYHSKELDSHDSTKRPVEKINESSKKTSNTNEKDKSSKPKKDSMNIDPIENNIPNNLYLRGEELLLEKPVWTRECYHPCPSVNYACVAATSSSYITDKYRHFVRPFCFYLKSLHNLPETIIDKHEIKQIFFEISLPPICSKVRTEKVPLHEASELKIKIVKTFFYQFNKDDAEILEVMQQNNLSITVYGIRNKIQEVSLIRQTFGYNSFSERTFKAQEANLFENMLLENKDKYEEAKIKKKYEAEEVLLGFCKMDASDFLEFDSLECKRLLYLHASSENQEENRYLQKITPVHIGRIHEDVYNEETGILSETQLIESGTFLKIAVKSFYNYKKLSLAPALNKVPFISRFFIIYENITMAYIQLEKLHEFNQMFMTSNSFGHPKVYGDFCLDEVLGVKKILFDKLHFKQKKIKKIKNKSLGKPKKFEDYTEVPLYVTGFMIDAISCCILLVEGPAYSTVPIIMTDNFELETSNGRLLYNSDLIFNGRLYEEFLMFGGLYVCGLGVPINYIIHQRCKILKRLIPKPAYKCAEILESILSAKKLSNDLFPTPKELLSLDIEYGVPVHRELVVNRCDSE